MHKVAEDGAVQVAAAKLKADTTAGSLCCVSGVIIGCYCPELQEATNVPIMSHWGEQGGKGKSKPEGLDNMENIPDNYLTNKAFQLLPFRCGMFDSCF